MQKNRLLLVGLVLVCLVVAVVGCTGNLPTGGVPNNVNAGNIIISQQNTGIWVTGEGKIEVVPDVVVLTLGVAAQENTVEQARSEAAQAMAAVMAVLDDSGVEERDIKTQHFSIHPVRDWEKDREIISGYRVTNTVTVRIREIDDTGTIIDAVAGAGGDLTRINSINFTVDEPDEFYAEVREKAMEDAAAKAEQLADFGGVNLGKPTYISEGSVASVSRDYFYMEAGAAVPSATPISPGETEIRLILQVVYGIK